MSTSSVTACRNKGIACVDPQWLGSRQQPPQPAASSSPPGLTVAGGVDPGAAPNPPQPLHVLVSQGHNPAQDHQPADPGPAPWAPSATPTPHYKATGNPRDPNTDFPNADQTWPAWGRTRAAHQTPPHPARAYHDHHSGSGAPDLPLHRAKPLAVHGRVPSGCGQRGDPVAMVRVAGRRAEVGPVAMGATVAALATCSGGPEAASAPAPAGRAPGLRPFSPEPVRKHRTGAGADGKASTASLGRQESPQASLAFASFLQMARCFHTYSLRDSASVLEGGQHSRSRLHLTPSATVARGA